MKVTLGGMKEKESNAEDRDVGVTHCLEASEDILEHRLYIALQPFLQGDDVSEIAWLFLCFFMPVPPY